MFRLKLLFILCLYNITHGGIIVKDNEISPSVIIIGAGAAGIAAASKLYENGFKDVKIFEADERIGGRIHSTLFRKIKQNYCVKH